MQSITHNNEAVSIDALLKPSANIDELLELASRFSIGQLILSRAAQSLLFRMLERKAKSLLRPGDELRHKEVSLKKKKDGDSCVLLRRGKLGDSDCSRQLKLLLRNGIY